jgi:hypothetical protein
VNTWVVLRSKGSSTPPLLFLKVIASAKVPPAFSNIYDSSGIMDIMTSVHEGFHNAPRLYGSNVCKSGKVTDFKSGVKEAGKVCIFVGMSITNQTNLSDLTLTIANSQGHD